MRIAAFFREWMGLRKFRALDPADRSIVFYAEDGGSWVHYEPVIKELTGNMGKRICYVTSSANDPVLSLHDENVRVYYIGLGSARTLFFLTLQAGVMVMTMPDLQTYQIKRSRSSVHYVYIYHSMISTHMSYRPGAFDNFDAILCVGPHHKEEIRATEALHRLPPKILVEHGYGRLEAILNSNAGDVPVQPPVEGDAFHVLVAPSWGPDSLLETCGSQLVEVLLRSNYFVTVRPHPMFTLQRGQVLSDLSNTFGSNPRFALDLDIASQRSLRASHVMISDWGGVALEYAFGLERPAILVDVPRKVMNPNYEDIQCTPFEVQIRSEIGAVASPDRLDEIPSMIENLRDTAVTWKEHVREIRTHWIYNIGTSGAAGASYISEAVERAAVSASTSST